MGMAVATLRAWDVAHVGLAIVLGSGRSTPLLGRRGFGGLGDYAYKFEFMGRY
jgi:hypothetical protein